jgi:hypothetical protein
VDALTRRTRRQWALQLLHLRPPRPGADAPRSPGRKSVGSTYRGLPDDAARQNVR